MLPRTCQNWKPWNQRSQSSIKTELELEKLRRDNACKGLLQKKKNSQKIQEGLQTAKRRSYADVTVSKATQNRQLPLDPLKSHQRRLERRGGRGI